MLKDIEAIFLSRAKVMQRFHPRSPPDEVHSTHKTLKMTLNLQDGSYYKQ